MAKPFKGVRYTQWHTTALCSPTRSCLLTGRNYTRNSMACITEAASGFPNAGEGLCVGRDSGEAVTEDYPGTAPWRFAGGTIKKVMVNVSGKPYVDLEREAVAMMARE